MIFKFIKVSVYGMVLFGDNKAEPVPNKTDLIKKEGSFVDEFGNIPITIWNKLKLRKKDCMKSKTFVFDSLRAKNTYQQ